MNIMSIDKNSQCSNTIQDNLYSHLMTEMFFKPCPMWGYDGVKIELFFEDCQEFLIDINCFFYKGAYATQSYCQSYCTSHGFTMSEVYNLDKFWINGELKELINLIDNKIPIFHPTKAIYDKESYRKVYGQPCTQQTIYNNLQSLFLGADFGNEINGISLILSYMMVCNALQLPLDEVYAKCRQSLRPLLLNDNSKFNKHKIYTACVAACNNCKAILSKLDMIKPPIVNIRSNNMFHDLYVGSINSGNHLFWTTDYFMNVINTLLNEHLSMKADDCANIHDVGLLSFVQKCYHLAYMVAIRDYVSASQSQDVASLVFDRFGEYIKAMSILVEGFEVCYLLTLKTFYLECMSIEIASLKKAITKIIEVHTHKSIRFSSDLKEENDGILKFYMNYLEYSVY